MMFEKLGSAFKGKKDSSQSKQMKFRSGGVEKKIDSNDEQKALDGREGLLERKSSTIRSSLLEQRKVSSTLHHLTSGNLLTANDKPAAPKPNKRLSLNIQHKPTQQDNNNNNKRNMLRHSMNGPLNKAFLTQLDDGSDSDSEEFVDTGLTRTASDTRTSLVEQKKVTNAIKGLSNSNNEKESKGSRPAPKGNKRLSLNIQRKPNQEEDDKKIHRHSLNGPLNEFLGTVGESDEDSDEFVDQHIPSTGLVRMPSVTRTSLVESKKVTNAVKDFSFANKSNDSQPVVKPNKRLSLNIQQKSNQQENNNKSRNVLRHSMNGPLNKAFLARLEESDEDSDEFVDAANIPAARMHRQSSMTRTSLVDQKKVSNAIKDLTKNAAPKGAPAPAKNKRFSLNIQRNAQQPKDEKKVKRHSLNGPLKIMLEDLGDLDEDSDEFEDQYIPSTGLVRTASINRTSSLEKKKKGFTRQHGKADLHPDDLEEYDDFDAAEGLQRAGSDIRASLLERKKVTSTINLLTEGTDTDQDKGKSLDDLSETRTSLRQRRKVSSTIKDFTESVPMFDEKMLMSGGDLNDMEAIDELDMPDEALERTTSETRMSLLEQRKVLITKKELIDGIDEKKLEHQSMVQLLNDESETRSRLRSKRTVFSAIKGLDEDPESNGACDLMGNKNSAQEQLEQQEQFHNGDVDKNHIDDLQDYDDDVPDKRLQRSESDTRTSLREQGKVTNSIRALATSGDSTEKRKSLRPKSKLRDLDECEEDDQLLDDETETRTGLRQRRMVTSAVNDLTGSKDMSFQGTASREQKKPESPIENGDDNVDDSKNIENQDIPVEAVQRADSSTRTSLRAQGKVSNALKEFSDSIDKQDENSQRGINKLQFEYGVENQSVPSESRRVSKLNIDLTGDACDEGITQGVQNKWQSPNGQSETLNSSSEDKKIPSTIKTFAETSSVPGKQDTEGNQQEQEQKDEIQAVDEHTASTSSLSDQQDVEIVELKGEEEEKSVEETTMTTESSSAPDSSSAVPEATTSSTHHATSAVAKTTSLGRIPRPGESLEVNPLGSLKYPFEKVYELGDVINEGFFGVVYKTHHVLTDPSAQVAVKIVNRSEEADDEALHEASILRDIRNVPHVTKLFDFYMDDEQIYVVQELAGGGDVLDRLLERETYTESDARDLVGNMLETLVELHQMRMVHRDIKPENLLLKTTECDSSILVCDYGYAKYLPNDGESGLWTFCGTPEYIAPEIINGVEYWTEVDMWSVGCIVYMLLSGFQPFVGRDNTEIFQLITAADYSFEDDPDAWGEISTEAKDLISNLLILDGKEKRWTAKQALECEWFSTRKSYQTQLELTDLKELVQEGIKDYCDNTRPYNDNTNRCIDRTFSGDKDHLYMNQTKKQDIDTDAQDRNGNNKIEDDGTKEVKSTDEDSEDHKPSEEEIIAHNKRKEELKAMRLQQRKEKDSARQSQQTSFQEKIAQLKAERALVKERLPPKVQDPVDKASSEIDSDVGETSKDAVWKKVLDQRYMTPTNRPNEKKDDKSEHQKLGALIGRLKAENTRVKARRSLMRFLLIAAASLQNDDDHVMRHSEDKHNEEKGKELDSIMATKENSHPNEKNDDGEKSTCSKRSSRPCRSKNTNMNELKLKNTKKYNRSKRKDRKKKKDGSDTCADPTSESSKANEGIDKESSEESSAVLGPETTVAGKTEKSEKKEKSRNRSKSNDKPRNRSKSNDKPRNRSKSNDKPRERSKSNDKPRERSKDRAKEKESSRRSSSKDKKEKSEDKPERRRRRSRIRKNEDGTVIA